MVDVCHVYCDYTNPVTHVSCRSRAHYGTPAVDDKPRLPSRCEEHRTPDMMRLNKRITCAFGFCETLPSYGPIGGDVVRCREHREDGMVNLKTFAQCEHPEGCFAQAIYAPTGEPRPVRCESHKDQYMELWKRPGKKSSLTEEQKMFARFAQESARGTNAWGGDAAVDDDDWLGVKPKKKRKRRTMVGENNSGFSSDEDVVYADEPRSRHRRRSKYDDDE